MVLTAAIAGTAVLAPAATQAVDLETPLKKDMWHDDVHTLQQDLKEIGFFDYHKSTGFFGDITYNGVKAFQEDYGITPTGQVNEETAEVLEEATSLLEKGDRGKAVAHLQKYLAELKLYNYHIDGIYGSITEQAVIDFQEKNDLNIDGIAGPVTKAALFNLKGDSVAASTEPKEEAAEPEPKKEPAEPEPKEEPASETAPADEATETITVEATAYTANCNGCSGVTATGIDLNANPDQKVIAVDPDVIPLGTEVYVEGYGRAIAGDTGGGIDGNEIDLYFQSLDTAVNWGRQTVEVQILG